MCCHERGRVARFTVKRQAGSEFRTHVALALLGPPEAGKTFLPGYATVSP